MKCKHFAALNYCVTLRQCARLPSMTPDEAHDEALRRVLSELESGPRTARAIAAALDCSKPTAYARIQALEDTGVKLHRSVVREGRTGPCSITFELER